MVDLRKWFLALALVLLTVATASAQSPAFACTASAGVPPLLRAEGLTELAGDIVLNCTGGDPLAGALQVNVQVFLNTNMTSRILSGTGAAGDPVEAVLLIGEPAPAAQIRGEQSATPPSAVANTYFGRKIGDNAVVWLGVPVVPPGSNATRVIRMTGIRANANQLGVASGLIPTQVFAYVSISGPTSIPLNNPQQTVGFIQNGLTFAVRDTGGDSISAAERTIKQCETKNEDLASDPTDGDCPQGYLDRLRFTENFATAFKTRVAASGQSSPGVVYNTESAYVNPSLQNAIAAYQNAGLAEFATRLKATFNNVPAGMRLYVSVAPISSSGGNSAIFVSNDPTGVGGSVLAPPAPTGCNISGARAYIELPVFNGTASAVWEVTATDPLLIGQVSFAVLVAYKANTANNLPGIGVTTVNGSYAPISSVGTASASAPIPRFADTSSAVNVIEIIACRTSLLFPFMTNQAGFDSGMTIANTSKDPFGTSNQSGTCTLNYYGNTNGGAAPPAQTTNVIPAGDHLAATLSGGGNFGVTATPGFQGYIIAVCQFQFAHGFAFISDVGAQRLAQGYLALVINPGSVTRDEPKAGTAESLGQ